MTIASISDGDAGLAVRTKLNQLLAQQVLHNLTATSDPTAGDDTGDGYQVGSVWLRSDTGDMWRCRDATGAAAKWTRLDNSDFQGYVAANWYIPYGVVPAAGGVGSATVWRFVPGTIKQRCTLTDLGARINTTHAGGNMRVALYANATGPHRPGLLLKETGNLSTASGAAVTETLGASITLEPGLYWWASQVDNATSIATSATPISSPFFSSLIGGTSAANALASTPMNSHSITGKTFGAFDADLSGATFVPAASTAAALVAFKVGSVP